MALSHNHKVLFIISSKSGGGRLMRKTKALALDAFSNSNLGLVPQIIITDHAGHASEAALAHANQYGENALIYVCGGDGTTNDVTQALANSKATMGVIPIGTANDLAKTLYGKKCPLEKILEATPYPQLGKADLIKINDTYSINVTSFGYDTTVLEAVYHILNRHPHLGSTAYPFAILKTIFNRESVPIQVDCLLEDGSTYNHKHNVILAAICNGAYYGGGFNPAPGALIDDGKLHLMLAEHMRLTSFLPLIFRYKKGTHLKSPYISLINVEHGTIKRLDQANLHANNDGEIFQANSISFALLKEHLSFAFLKIS